MDKGKPSLHTKYLTEQIEAWRYYLDHTDKRARLTGLRMLLGEIDYLITMEAEETNDSATNIERFAKIIREKVASLRRIS